MIPRKPWEDEEGYVAPREELIKRIKDLEEALKEVCVERTQLFYKVRELEAR